MEGPGRGGSQRGAPGGAGGAAGGEWLRGGGGFQARRASGDSTPAPDGRVTSWCARCGRTPAWGMLTHLHTQPHTPPLTGARGRPRDSPFTLRSPCHRLRPRAPSSCPHRSAQAGARHRPTGWLAFDPLAHTPAHLPRHTAAQAALAPTPTPAQAKAGCAPGRHPLTCTASPTPVIPALQRPCGPMGPPISHQSVGAEHPDL